MKPEQLAAMQQQLSTLINVEGSNVAVDWKAEYIKMHNNVVGAVKQAAAAPPPPVVDPEYDHINIIFDGRPGPAGPGNFVEVENDDGESIKVGEWIDDGESNTVKLRIRLHKDALAPAESDVEYIARVAHEINRAYCQSLNDDSQPTWEDAEPWQRESAINGVQFHIDMPDASVGASHENWRNEKMDSGWVHGPEKDILKQQHPCLIPFASLPLNQQVKDHLFRQVVHSLI